MGEGIKACARPTGSPVSESEQRKTKEEITTEKEGVKMIRVGQKPPDFTALAYHKGKIINVKLSGHLNKWVLLCFYPGDFTYVLATEISAVA